MPTLETQLVTHLSEILAYARRKMQDPDLAADAVQQSLLKALEGANQLRDTDKLLPWFYRILNNTIADLYRQQSRTQTRDKAFADRAETTVLPADQAQLCQCVDALLPTLKPEYATVIAALDLREEAPDAVAKRLGITRGNLKVRRFRARQQLRQRLEETCRTCATHGCLDCSCTPHP